MEGLKKKKERESVWRALVALHSLRQILWCVVSSLMEPCRYDMECWRPLCPYGHSGRPSCPMGSTPGALLGGAGGPDRGCASAADRGVTWSRSFPRSTSRSGSSSRTCPFPRFRNKLWKSRMSFPRSASRSVLLNRFTMYQCLRSRNKFWKSRRSPRRGASRSVSSNTLVMYPCLRFANKLSGVVKNIPAGAHLGTYNPNRHVSPQTQYTRQGCCRAYCDTATGPSVSDCAKDEGSSAGEVHRQFCGRPL